MKANNIRDRLKKISDKAIFTTDTEQCKEYESIYAIRTSTRQKGLRKFGRIYVSGFALNIKVKEAQPWWILVGIILEKKKEKSKTKLRTIQNLSKRMRFQNWTRVLLQQLWSVRAPSRIKYYKKIYKK